MKINNLKHSLLIMISILFLLTGMTFIAAAQETENNEEMLEFEWYASYDWGSSMSFGETFTEEWIIDNKNVMIEFTSAQGAAEQRLNTMMVSDDYPDVMWMDRGQNVERLADAGRLVALDPWLEDSNLLELVGEETLNLLRSDDGKLYQFPNWYISGDGMNGNSGWVVNQEIYQELGSPELETFADLYNYLKEVDENYDVIPFETSFDFQGAELIYAGMGERRTTRFISDLYSYPVDNKLESIYDDPAFKESMVFINKLYREGLITQDGFTQTRDQAEEKFNNARVAVAAAGDIISPISDANNLYLFPSGHPGYEMLWPLHKEGLEQDNIYVGNVNKLGWNVNVITISAENPERIFKFMDWMTSPEGQRIVAYGPKGVFYNEVDEEGYPIVNENYINSTSDEMNKVLNNSINRVGNTMWVDTAKVKVTEQLPEEERDWGAVNQYKYTWNTSVDITEFANVTPGSGSEMGEAYQRVGDIFEEYYARMVFADSEEEVLDYLAEAKTEAENAGEAELLEFMTEKWQENRETMGGGSQW